MNRRAGRPSAAVVAASEAAASIFLNPGRSALIALGAVVGAALYTTTLGLTGTASSQVREDFDAFRATEVVATSETDDVDWVSASGLESVSWLNGVVAVGAARFSDERHSVSTSVQPEGGLMVRVSGVTPGALEVMKPEIIAGRLFDEIHEEREIPVAVIPESLAQDLVGVRLGSQLRIGKATVVVIGSYRDLRRGLDLLGSVLVPLSASEPWLSDVPPEVYVEVAPGAARTVARQLPLALRPDAPEAVAATSLLDPEQFRLRVEGRLVQLSVMASIAALVIGAVVIGVSAASSVSLRTPEFGLRRALGATPWDLGSQVLGETLLLGGLGGLVGASVGLLATVGIALTNGWTPALDVAAAAWAAVFAAGGGLVGGLFPARRAMRIEPAEALRR